MIYVNLVSPMRQPSFEYHTFGGPIRLHWPYRSRVYVGHRSHRVEIKLKGYKRKGTFIISYVVVRLHLNVGLVDNESKV